MQSVTELPSPTAARLWLRQTAAFAERFVRELSRSWIGLFWSFGFPIMWYWLTAHIGLTPTTVGAMGRFKAILGVSFAVFGALTVTLVGFTGDLSVDVSTKRYRKFRSLPLRPSADLAGRFLAGLVLGLVAATVLLVVAALDGARYVIPSTTGIVVIGVTLGLFSLVGMVAGVGVTIAVPDPRYATTIGTGILLVVFFVTGYNGTVPTVFPFAAWWVNYLPNTLAARILIRELVAVDWAVAGLRPPPPPEGTLYPLLLGGYAIGLTAIAIIAMRVAIYHGDAGE